MAEGLILQRNEFLFLVLLDKCPIKILLMKFLKSLFARKSEGDYKIEVVDNYEEFQDITEYARKAISLLEQSTENLENDQVLELFEKHGFPKDVAGRVLVFLPIAFVRCWLTDVNWLDTYQVLLENGTLVRRRYGQTTAYLEILAVTKEYFNKGPNPDTIIKIGGRSAEFHVLNNLLKSGGQLSDVRFTESVIVF